MRATTNLSSASRRCWLRARDLSRSYELKAKAERLIPGCSQTFSKGPSQFVQNVAPVFLARGSGSHVWDVDGNKYIDYAMALGRLFSVIIIRR